MSGWTPGHVDPVVIPPDIESTVVYYAAPLVAPTPVATRIPGPANQADTINDFLRVESGGGNRANYLEWDLAFILHAYSPVEMNASTLAAKITAYCAAARGLTINGAYVSRVVNVVAPHRLTDPNVNLIRYRSMVTWRMPGSLVTAGS